MRGSGKVAFGLGGLGVAALHFVLSFFVSFAAGLSSQNSPWSLASKILMFPLLSIPEPKGLPDWIGWPIWIALSLSWGFAICWAIRRFARGTKS